MPLTDANRTPEQKAKREAQLARMREKWQRDPPRSQGHTVTRQKIVTVTETIKPKNFTPGELAHAIRIAAKDAKERPNPNPAYVEALELAATFFDDL